MLTVILSILAYGHDSLMLLIYYSRTLGRRYSLKITAAATGVWWVMQCACKLPVMYFADEYSMSVVMMLQCLLMGGYLFLCYGSSPAKKLLAMLLVTVTLGLAEITAILIAENIAEAGSRVLEAGSEFTVAGILLARPLAVLAYYLAFLIWRTLERVSWLKDGRQWLCVLLPLSQLFLLWYFTEVFIDGMRHFSFLTVAGALLSIFADAYMFVIFDRAREREDMEKELRLQKHLYELEQIRYHKLMESQEELERLRHDYQNYLLLLRAMPEGGHEEPEEGAKA